MAVLVQTPTASYVGNGSLKTFAYPFRVDEEADMKVFVDGELIASGYSLTDLGNENGGNVVFDTAPANGIAIRFVRKTTYSRSTDYLQGGALNADTLDRDIDRTVMMIQEFEVSSTILNDAGNLDLGGGKIINAATPTTSTDGATKAYVDAQGPKSKVSANDSTAGYLNGKLLAGTNISFTEGNDGSNETLTIAVTTPGLNADTVDGQHASAFAAASHSHTLSQITDYVDASYVKTTGNFVIGGDLTLNGNVSINGTLTTINATNLEVSDPEVVFNQGETGTGVSAGTSGIRVDRGLATDARFVFDETDDQWKIDNGTGTLVALYGVAHTHTESEITDLGNYSVVGHAHAASDITSGTFADARIAQTNVTQHQGALTITESQISDLKTYLTSISAQSIESLADVATMTKATNDLLRWNGTTWTNVPQSTYSLSSHNHSGVYSEVGHTHSGYVADTGDTMTGDLFNTKSIYADRYLGLKHQAVAWGYGGYGTLYVLSSDTDLYYNNGTTAINIIDNLVPNSNLSDLADVSNTAPTSGYVLTWNGSAWAPAASTGGGASTLDDLTDVVVTTPASGHLLYHNGTNWLNGTAGSAGVLPLTGGTLTGALSGTSVSLSSYEELSEIAAPATPSAGKVRLYAKTDGKLYIKDDTGTETDLTASGTGTTLDGLTDTDLTGKSDGDSLVYNGTSGKWEPTAVGGGTPSVVLLDSGTHNSTSAKTFTSLITSDYKYYELILDNIYNSVDGDGVAIQVSTDNGSTWITSSDYVWLHQGYGRGTGSGFYFTGSNDADVDVSFMTYLGTSTNERGAARITIYNPLSTSDFTRFNWSAQWLDNAAQHLYSTGGGSYKSTAAVNAFQIYPWTGGATLSFNYSLYGYK